MSEGKRRTGKRGHGEGTIGQRPDGRWIAQVMVGYKPDGKPDRRTVYGKTRAECQRKLDELKRRRDGGMLGDAKAGRETVGAYLTWWLTSVEGTMDAESLRRHRDNVGRMKPLIGRLKLAELRPEHLVTMFATLRGTTYTRGRSAKDRPLSPRTVKYCFTTIRKALDLAVRNGAVPRNVARVIEVPKVPKVEVVAHRHDDMGRVLDTFEASDDRLAPLYTLAVFTGCRRGELLGLKWDDMDFEAGTVTVRRTLRGAKGGTPDFREGGKTSRAVRTFKLSADAVAALQVQRDRQAFERQALGDAYADHGLVFATPLGTPLDPDNTTNRLKRVLKAAGLPMARPFHTLRHDNATLSLRAGVNPKTMADRLGHHSPAFTLERYVHAVRRSTRTRPSGSRPSYVRHARADCSTNYSK